jgi:hypothetical protein
MTNANKAIASTRAKPNIVMVKTTKQPPPKQPTPQKKHPAKKAEI